MAKQRKRKQNYAEEFRTNPMTGKRERVSGGINMPDPFGSTPQFITGKGPAGFDPMGDIQRQQKEVDKTKQDRDLRSQLESKRKRGRKDSAMRTAMSRRQSRTFTDPQALNRFVQGQGTAQPSARGQQQNQDMDDTIVQRDGQYFRYDSEIDDFTPVQFDPAKNRFEFAGEKELDAAKSDASMDESFKVAQKSFDKQMGELRGLADQDQQFGDMYQELQGEYLEILREPNLRPEERNKALQDLFDRGSQTFSATSGFAREAATTKKESEIQEAKSKMQEDLSYRNRRASETKQKIRDKQEDDRIDNAKTREKFSETTQKATADYNTYLEQQKSVEEYNMENDRYEIDDEGNPIIPERLSREEFLMERYKQMHTDQVVQDTVRDIDVDVSLLETEIGQIEEADPMEYRMQLTSIYGQGKQEYADAAFEAHLRERDSRLANNRRKISDLKLRRAETLARPMVNQEAEYAVRKRADKETGRAQGEVVKSQKEQRKLRGVADIGGFILPYAFPSDTYREAADVEAGAEKIMAKDAAVDRDMNRTLEDGSPNPNFGKVTSMDTPNYVKQELGDPTIAGKLRRLAHPESSKKYFKGDNQARSKAEYEVIKSLNPLIQKMNPDMQPDSAEFNTARREYYDRVIAFEQSFDKEQLGSRG